MKRILFVEDDRSLLQGLSFALKKQGYALTAARTREEGERLWAEGDYDLVLLDVALPDGSGLELCRKIRKTSRVPVMFLTAADEETDIIMGLDIGGDDYITKPFKLAVFLSRVNALLRRSGKTNEQLAVHLNDHLGQKQRHITQNRVSNRRKIFLITRKFIIIPEKQRGKAPRAGAGMSAYDVGDSRE